MIISTLDGKTYKWRPESIDKQNKSNLHKNAAVLIKNIFKTSSILEEVQIQIKQNKYLYLDFYLPLYKLAIEIQGEQHTKYNNFFYKTPLNFIKQKINDSMKQQWCELNNITLIKLEYDKQPDEWRNQLINCGLNNENT